MVIVLKADRSDTWADCVPARFPLHSVVGVAGVAGSSLCWFDLISADGFCDLQSPETSSLECFCFVESLRFFLDRLEGANTTPCAGFEVDPTLSAVLACWQWVMGWSPADRGVLPMQANTVSGHGEDIHAF